MRTGSVFKHEIHNGDIVRIHWNAGYVPYVMSLYVLSANYQRTIAAMVMGHQLSHHAAVNVNETIRDCPSR